MGSLGSTRLQYLLGPFKLDVIIQVDMEFFYKRTIFQVDSQNPAFHNVFTLISSDLQFPLHAHHYLHFLWAMNESLLQLLMGSH